MMLCQNDLLSFSIVNIELLSKTLLIIPMSACYYSELRSAITIFFIKKRRLCSIMMSCRSDLLSFSFVNIELLSKTLLIIPMSACYYSELRTAIIILPRIMSFVHVVCVL